MNKNRSEKAMAFANVLYKWDIDYRLTAAEHTGEVKFYSPEEIAEYVDNNANQLRGNIMSETITPEIGMQFNSTGIFNDFCADNIGATMHDMKVNVKYELIDTFDVPTGDIILEIEVHIALAQEANALHEYMNALHECYGEDCGHSYIFRITLLEFTPTSN